MEALKILVVDDEPRMRKLVRDFLTVKGFQDVYKRQGERCEFLSPADLAELKK